MKKQYQIRAQRAIDKFQEWANGDVDPIQLSLPAADMLKLAHQSLGELLRHVGKMFVESVLEAEVEQVAGQRSKPDPGREAYRWGTERGYVMIDGQKVPIEKPRVRDRQNNHEIALGSYELFQRASLVGETVWRKIMYGLTMRSYKEVLQQFVDAYGLEKSTVSDHFVEASRVKLEQLLSRSLTGLSLCAIFIDGTIFKGERGRTRSHCPRYHADTELWIKFAQHSRLNRRVHDHVVHSLHRGNFGPPLCRGYCCPIAATLQ